MNKAGRPRRELSDRINEKIRIIDSGCHIWIGHLKDGYGRLQIDGKRQHYAHRVIWELRNGSVPKGYELDHLCRNRACVNVDHLECVTHKENTMRGLRAIYGKDNPAFKTHCKRGHKLDGDNVRFYEYSRNGKQYTLRQCVACVNLRAKEQWERNK